MSILTRRERAIVAMERQQQRGDANAFVASILEQYRRRGTLTAAQWRALGV